MKPISGEATARPDDSLETKTPIKHLVVIFQENASFFSYFATYPLAENPTDVAPLPPVFEARRGTPSVNGLTNSVANFNPNLVNPFRIARLDSYTCDQNHGYQAELETRNQGLMNLMQLAEAAAQQGSAIRQHYEAGPFR